MQGEFHCKGFQEHLLLFTYIMFISIFYQVIYVLIIYYMLQTIKF